MTELTIPPDADEKRATELVQEFVSIGDVVEIRDQNRTEGDTIHVTGTVTGLESGYLEIDEQPPSEGSVRYDSIHTVSKVESR